MSRARYVLAVSAPAAVVVLACALWAAAALPQLPDPLATHFTGLPMRADGWSAPGSSVALLVALSIGMLALQAGLATMPGNHGAGARFLGACMSGSTAVIALLIPATLVPQTGLDDVRDLVLPGWSPALLAIGAVVFAAIGALIPPPPAPEQKDPADGAADPVIDVPAGGATAWFGSGTLSRIPFIILVAAAAAAAGTIAVVGFSGAGAGVAALTAVVAVLVVTATVSFLRVRVRVDARGIHWRMLLGLPRGSIPWGEIDGVSVEDVQPGAWGGWGLRANGDAWGVILRDGEALRVSRISGGARVFTVDDADTAAAVARGHLRRR